MSDQTTKWVSSREAAELSGGSDRGTRQKASEKTAKTEDGVLGEFHGFTKASPRPMVERSPSSTSLDRRFNNNQSSARWSSEVEETGLRNNARDFSAPEDERLRVDETSQGDISFNNKPNQNNSSFPPRPESRSGMSSPRVGLREDDNRGNTGGRYRRGVDGMMGRGQQTQGNNAWRGVPSWPAPLPNGFIPFQPHGFQTMMPQYPSPSIFGVRPSMEMNHSGIPYHIPDAERFSGHMRPLGWQNMMESSGAASSHMHGFFGDMSNSAFRGMSQTCMEDLSGTITGGCRAVVGSLVQMNGKTEMEMLAWKSHQDLLKMITRLRLLMVSLLVAKQVTLKTTGEKR